jgi:Fic family protein
VRVIAQNQNQNQAKLEQNIEKIQSRGGFTKFIVGPNYGEIKDAQKTLEQNREQIRQLNQIRNQLTNEGDQQQLVEQVRILEQANLEIENSLTDAQNGFSLFGWLNKLIY